MHDYYKVDDLLSCGHAPSREVNTVWWCVGKYGEAATQFAGTLCFDCALTAEKLDLKVDLIPTNEQLLAELDWKLAGIGSN